MVRYGSLIYHQKLYLPPCGRLLINSKVGGGAKILTYLASASKQYGTTEIFEYSTKLDLGYTQP